MTDSKLLREYIKRAGLKLQFVAEQLGLSRFALQMKIDNESEFKVSEALALAELLGMSEEEMGRIFFNQKVD